MKRCNTCKTEKPILDFARSRDSSDGRKSKCRSCQSAYYREYGKEKGAARRRDPEYRRRQRAREKLNWAVKSGRIARQPCVVCRTTVDIEGHHDDYDKPEEVTWFCRQHHKHHHSGYPA